MVDSESETWLFYGRLIWLTPEQGGRTSGPPIPSRDRNFYAATAFVPPLTAETGSASIAITGFEPHALASMARAKWLVVPNEDDHLIEPGTILVCAEGARVVAFFLVERVMSPVNASP